ncbi:STAS domain-containing protein [Streptomyces lavendofoliae]|uniref:STAS domain-containing protein n=1 Tax=Streptomyces lavendofoliae TaxID=67314 RepID=UPI00300F5DF3
MTEIERPLTITQQSDADGPVRLRVAGELDHHNAHRLRETFTSVPFATSGGVIVDLSGLDYCDSTGLTALITGHHQARSAGSTLSIAGLKPHLERVFRIAGIDQVIPLLPTPERPSGEPAVPSDPR